MDLLSSVKAARAHEQARAERVGEELAALRVLQPGEKAPAVATHRFRLLSHG